MQIIETKTRIPLVLKKESLSLLSKVPKKDPNVRGRDPVTTIPDTNATCPTPGTYVTCSCIGTC